MSTGSERFAVFILTHGRPHKQFTLKTLQRQGYTGDVWLIVDNEDDTLEEYRCLYGEKVVVFDKQAVAQVIDEGDNFQDHRGVVYARNACYQIAADLGLDYFLQLDDDYSAFVYKYDANLASRDLKVKNLDRLFATMLDYYRSIPAVTIALAQGGDFFGRPKGSVASRLWLKRKAMNTFFCSVRRPLTFFGRVNEDVNTYVTLGNRGELFLTVFNAAIKQEQTQRSAGGMTELYRSQGTYVKSFYTVMYAPSCVKVSEMGYLHRRIHHKISWENAVPCIVGEEHRKARE